MSDVPETFAHYLAAWNERDPASIRGHLDLAVADDVVFVDPANTTTGVDQLEAMIVEARAAMPDVAYRTASGIDGHNQRYRYRWEVHTLDEVLVTGMDFVTVDAGGRLERIDGFFGDFTPTSTPA
jgi:hypothetical protein